jgi:hypothetical protein
MPRRNLCPNPAVGVDVTGWAGSSTPTRTAVGGFLRPTVARYTAGTFLETPRSAVSPGDVVTLSLYIQFPTFALNSSGNTYIAWQRLDGSNISFDSAGYVTTLNNVTRLDRTATAPAQAATVSLVLDGSNFASNPVDVTAMLVELVGTLDTYADGDSANWVWDGTAGLSPSRESPDQTLTPDSIASTVTVAAPTLTPGAVTVAPDGITSGATVGSPSLTPGPVTISPASIPSAASVGSPVVGRHTAPTTLAPHPVGGVTSLAPTPAPLP